MEQRHCVPPLSRISEKGSKGSWSPSSDSVYLKEIFQAIIRAHFTSEGSAAAATHGNALEGDVQLCGVILPHVERLLPRVVPLSENLRQ